jgi:hypothetical protein
MRSGAASAQVSKTRIDSPGKGVRGSGLQKNLMSPQRIHTGLLCFFFPNMVSNIPKNEVEQRK